MIFGTYLHRYMYKTNNIWTVMHPARNQIADFTKFVKRGSAGMKGLV